MSVTFVSYLANNYAAQYTLSNQTDVQAWLADLYPQYPCTISSNVITYGGGRLLHLTDWVFQIGFELTDADFAAQYSEYVTPDEITTQVALGIAAIPSVNAGGNATMNVTIKPTMPGTYTAASAISGSLTLLGQLSVTSTTIVNSNTVSVVVHNGALLTVSGGTLFVVCVAS